ncbi:MAG TPA: hypothetical protein VNJ10_08070 [Sphingomonas sp.]|nr:hypothetical protein [Sphingomonas sp.]
MIIVASCLEKIGHGVQQVVQAGICAYRSGSDCRIEQFLQDSFERLVEIARQWRLVNGERDHRRKDRGFDRASSGPGARDDTGTLESGCA